MRLLYITNGITGSGGLERVLSIKASLLAENYKYQVHILSLNEAGRNPFFSISTKVTLHSINVSGNPISYIKSYIKGIQSIINIVEPDIILVCDDGLKGFFLPRLLKTKARWIYERHVSKLIAIRSHHGLIRNYLTKIQWFLMEKLGKGFSRFVVLTETNKKEWMALPNVIVIPNPLPFYPASSSSLNNKQVICVGKISFQKGQDLLVSAWKSVLKYYPEWTLQLYGKSNESFLNTKDLTIHNINYFEAEKNIMHNYLESSIYVMSSRFEGFGMVLIEAMACGVPCISFDCNHGPSDIITHGEDGILVEQNNVKKLAESIKILMNDEFLRKEMGKKAKQNVLRYSPHVIIEVWDELLKSLLIENK